MFKQWKNDPLWPEMVKTISDPSSYPHAVHVLLCASQFPDQHVSFIPTSYRTRSPDLLVEFDHGNKLTIEVKAPQKLQRPQPMLDGELSEREIIRLVRKSDHCEGGQLGSGMSALLAIGGFHLGMKDLENLRKGIEQYFSRKGSRRRHLYGIAIPTLGALLENVVLDVDGRLRAGNNTRMRSFSRVQLTLNPFYKGPIMVTSFSEPHDDLE